MPLEATMMVIDNSEYMRNGDYQPTRFGAQSDAVAAVSNSKIDSNPENTVGVMTSAGKGPEVLVTHTKELGQILQGLHKSSERISGAADIPTALSVAQLALKHRQNKNLRQRIVLFIGSPLAGAGADEKGMVKLAKKMKKNNIAVDVVLFGDEEGRNANEGLLRVFVDNVSSGDNSHLISIPPGSDILSDALLSSPILSGDFPGGAPDTGRPAASSAAAGPSNDFEFGVDPSLDPELAMALRMSLEEERARQAAAASSSSTSAAPTLETIPELAPTTTATTNAPVTDNTTRSQAPPPTESIDEDDEETMLQRALAMSRGEDVDMVDAEEVDVDEDEDEEMSEEEAIAKAIAMSMQDNGQGESSEKDGKK